MSSISTHRNNSNLISSTSTFNWSDSNLKQLLHLIPFQIITMKNDQSQPFCHYAHKNLKWKEAPFLGQEFYLKLEELTNIKHIVIENFTHGSEMTISISDKRNPLEFTEVYKEKFICKGKTLKNETKTIDIGALPCHSMRVKVSKGTKISSKNIRLVGVESYKIEEQLGQEYFKLLVINPLRIIYPE